MLSDPDPKQHLLNAGWSVHVDEDGTMWSKMGDFDLGMIDGAFRIYAHPTIDISPADMYALTLLAIGAHEPSVKPVADSLANSHHRQLWTEIVHQQIADGSTMARAIADADMFIDALRKRGA